MPLNETFSIILAVLTAAAAGLIGSFALMRKTILAGDVMSHLAIPGLGLAVIWKLNPLFGAAATLLLGAFAIWQLEKRTFLSTEAAIGVIFVSSVALGALLINSKEELVDVLFGGFDRPSLNEFIFGLAVNLFIIVAFWLLRDKFIISFLPKDLAIATGLNVDTLNLWFLILFALTILSGLRFLGALLAGALIIIPASTSRELTYSWGGFLGLSVLLAILSVGLGFWVATTYHLELSPTIILVAAAMFGLSLLKKKK